MPAYKGSTAVIEMDTGTGYEKVGYTSSVTVDVTRGLEPVYEHGSEDAVDLVSGRREITGTIERAWVDTKLFKRAGQDALTDFKLRFKASNVSGAPMVELEYCKPEGGSLDLPEDGILTESFDFRARKITVSTVV